MMVQTAFHELGLADAAARPANAIWQGVTQPKDVKQVEMSP